MNWVIKSLLLMGCLALINCKSSKSVVTDQGTAMVKVQLKKDIKPEDLQGKSPFTLVKKKPKDWTTNTWELTFNLANHTKQDLSNYLMSLDKVVAVDDNTKNVTPPIRGPKSMEAKKQ